MKSVHTAGDLLPSPERINEKLGPFNPPADFKHPAEFDGPTPRPIPHELRHGPAARRSRAASEALLTVGAVLFVVHRTGWLDRLSVYLLPLGYLGWIGIGLAVLGLSLMVARRLPPTTKYVRDGTPAVGRLIHYEAIRLPDDDLRFGFALGLEYRDPETHRIEHALCITNAVGFHGSEKRYDLALRPGDYCTVVGMPGKFAETLRVYGLLGLNPDLAFVQRDGQLIRPWPMWMTVCAPLAITAGVCLFLLAGTQVVARMPREGFGTLGVVAGIAAAIGLAVSILTLRYSKKPTPRSKQDVFGVFVLGVAGIPILACIATILGNAFLDRSPPDYRDIEVVEMIQTTHSGIWRNYDLKYRELATGREESQTTIVDVLDAFSENELGVIDVAAGAFGMPWVRGMHALLLVPVTGHEAALATYEVDYTTASGEEGVFKLRPMIQTGPDSYVAPSAALLSRLAERIAAESPGATHLHSTTQPAHQN